MASGSQLMTTYYAKRIIGDNAASTADQALLQTGQSITTNTWILNRTNRANYGILYHYDSNGADKIKFIGGIDNNSNDIETAWIQLGTGDTHILGRVGIGEDPTINNNSYKLYINGTTYTNAPVYINNSTTVAMAGDNGALVIGDKAGLNIGIDNCKIHARNNSAAANLLLNSEGGNITLGINNNNYYVDIRSTQDASSTSTGALRVGGGVGIAKKLYVGDDIHDNGHLYFVAAKNIYMNYNSIDYPILENSNDSNIILNAATGILNIGYRNTTGINMYYSTDDSTRTQFFTINSDGAYANTRFGVNGQDTNYTLYVNGTSFFNNRMYLAALDLNTSLNLYTSSDDSPDIVWWYADKEQEQARIWVGSGGTSIFAPSYRCYASDGTSLYSGNLVIGDGTGVTNAANFRGKLSTWALVSSSHNTFMPPDGTTNAWYKFGTADGYGILPAVNGSAESGHSSIGTSSWYWKYLYVDRAYTGKITIQQPETHRDNGIVGTYDSTKAAAIWSMGASYQIAADGSGLGKLYGAAYGYGGRNYLGNNAYAGGHQFLWCENGAVRVALGDNIWTVGKVTASGGFVGALTGNVTGNCSGSSGSCTGNAATATKVGESTSWLYFHHSNEVNFGGTYNSNTTIYFGYRAVDSRGKPTDFVFGSGSGTANVKAAKVYNAVWNDYAEYRCGEIIEGGYCVTETSNGILQKTIKRLQPACHLTSDTWGTIMGKTKDAKTPIAVAGRVLAYPYRTREHYHLGDALCSAPGGTVDIMTREEIREYPERIVGIVSEIPDYEVWHAGAQDGNHEIEVNGRIWIYVR